MLEFIENIDKTFAKYKCCYCNTICIKRKNNVNTGKTKSCGCWKLTSTSLRFKKHGQCGKSVEYRTWIHMLTRCRNENCLEYKNYGGRGIIVCKEWENSFEKFYLDMGKRPSSKHSIDRIDTNGNYCPENCRWATITEQQNNRRNNRLETFNGETKTVAEWSRQYNLPLHVVYLRLKYNWTIEKTLTTPVKKQPPKILREFRGKFQSVRAWSRELNISREAALKLLLENEKNDIKL